MARQRGITVEVLCVTDLQDIETCLPFQTIGHTDCYAVLMDLATDEDVEIVDDQLVPTKSGVFGYPTKATAKKGRLLFDRIVEELSKAI